jgi:hypothetical protein
VFLFSNYLIFKFFKIFIQKHYELFFGVFFDFLDQNFSFEIKLTPRNLVCSLLFPFPKIQRLQASFVSFSQNLVEKTFPKFGLKTKFWEKEREWDQTSFFGKGKGKGTKFGFFNQILGKRMGPKQVFLGRHQRSWSQNLVFSTKFWERISVFRLSFDKGTKVCVDKNAKKNKFF